MPSQKLPLDERIHSVLMRGFGLRTRDFSHESVERPVAALNKARLPLPPVGGEVLWMSAPIAFTLPGHYAYISRAFVECCQSDAPVAFALAHEIGHLDLGHTNRIGHVLTAEGLLHAPGKLAIIVLEVLSRLLYSRDYELAADGYALGLCRKAGFDLKKCLECFDILTRYSLDHHDLDGVYGSDEEIELDPDDAANAVNRLYIEFRLWCARHRRSHPSLYERRRVLLKLIAEMEPTEAPVSYPPSATRR
jgi:Zn-dependent protease with chaperone function